MDGTYREQILLFLAEFGQEAVVLLLRCSQLLVLDKRNKKQS